MDKNESYTSLPDWHFLRGSLRGRRAGSGGWSRTDEDKEWREVEGGGGQGVEEGGERRRARSGGRRRVEEGKEYREV